ncbi:MAG: hypothetical protein WD904_11910 [Dehalococcoidia bacterium]
MYPENGVGVDSLIKAADQAMYQAKGAGGDQSQVAGADAAPAVLDTPPFHSGVHRGAAVAGRSVDGSDGQDFARRPRDR